ncbi:MAG: NAD-dependent epimerase/dehydratase family protein [Bacteroidota bacterium]|nr:NAD-dependent epimerase/dehydratase family protein [Bacteroidota bacterium]
MRILVTGGAGFIGSNLVHRLVKDGHEVVVLDNLVRGNKIDPAIFRKVIFFNKDIRDLEAVQEASKDCDVIFHLAAILGVDIVADNPVETMDVETVGMRNVAIATLNNGIKKILYASTSGIYGHSAMEKSVDEKIMVDPRTSYAMAKRYNEIYLSALNDEKGIQSVALRFFNVYGYNQDNRMVIPRFFEQALKGEPITVFSKGLQTRDFTYIDDTIESCIRLMNKDLNFEIFNIANENELSVIDLAKRIKEITNSSSEILFIEAPDKRYDYEVERRVGSSKKLFEYVQYKPSTSLEDGLKYIFEKNYKK